MSRSSRIQALSDGADVFRVAVVKFGKHLLLPRSNEMSFA